MSDALLPIGMGLAAVVAGFTVLFVLRLALRRAARRSPAAAAVVAPRARPAHVAVLLAAIHLTLNNLPDADWHRTARHVLYLADIGVLAWGAIAALMIVMDLALARYRTDVRDNRHARRVHTQVSVIRRIGIAGFAVVAMGAMLLTFPAFRAAGASVLASAGIVGVIAGLAAQSLLSNVFAGMQIVFSEALHLDDVVVVEGEWGRIEEITLTYVVVRIWDDRRLVLPTSYFLSTPFENWTRTEAAVIGTVELDLDWSVPVEALREELELALKENERWDGRTCVAAGHRGDRLVRADPRAGERRRRADAVGPALRRPRAAGGVAAHRVPVGAAQGARRGRIAGPAVAGETGSAEPRADDPPTRTPTSHGSVPRPQPDRDDHPGDEEEQPQATDEPEGRVPRRYHGDDQEHGQQDGERQAGEADLGEAVRHRDEFRLQSLPEQDAVHGHGRDQQRRRHGGDQQGDQVLLPQAGTDLLAEPLLERDREQEGEEDLDSGLRHAQLLQQLVVVAVGALNRVVSSRMAWSSSVGTRHFYPNGPAQHSPPRGQ